MIYTRRISEVTWGKIYTYLESFRESRALYLGDESECRRFVEAVFWMARSGSQWRFLPPDYGNWNSVYKRFSNWAKKGVWYKMLYYFAQDPDMEYIMIDSTILRAHACATPKKNSRNKKD